MDRQPPRTTGDEVDLYIRTYYSLLRSTGEVLVRAFEESHAYSRSSLHADARKSTPDVAAFAYSAARLPNCMPEIEHLIIGQSHEQFEADGIPVGKWRRVQTRGRRRALRWNLKESLAVFVTSTSDIDDLIPILTAYQIEWNKLHAFLRQSFLGPQIKVSDGKLVVDPKELQRCLQLDPSGIETLCLALGEDWALGLQEIAKRPLDLKIRMLNGSYSQYQRASQRWWGGIEPTYLAKEEKESRRPVYFVSSNSHSMVNLVGGYARKHREEILDFAKKNNPEGLAEPLQNAIDEGREEEVLNLTYYLLRGFLRDAEPDDSHLGVVQEYDRKGGIEYIQSPGKIDVGAQIIDIGKLQPDRFDPRVANLGAGFEDLSRLSESNAVIINIDYPLGMAAYHHLARLLQGVGEIRGIYVMGKAATLNGRVGDVMISAVVQDEHSDNTYLFRNCFSAADVQPYLKTGTVLDTQKALTVRGAFLQNRDYIGSFYKEGYTVLEMEAGPYLSAIYEAVYPNRHPDDEIIHLSNLTPFDVGVLHYASDTPYSRRQSLLSKSLSYFGVDSTYACSIPILQRILRSELSRIEGK